MPQPPFRKLRGYAFDPSLSLKIDTATINEMVYKVKWEELEKEGPDPTGEYLDIVDYDPTVRKFYKPIDFNDKYILAQDGIEPGEGNPQFHQQMVYAVIMTTINNFEKALGRKVLWAPRRVASAAYEEYVSKLRVYPHAIRDANAYYSPLKKALLFGYFSSTPADETLQMPDSLVFTALSHDIVAHETTHAILDGMHTNYNNATNPDVLAFHEAFADIVALFQHFTFPEVLRHQIARTRGDLTSQNLLGQLAQQFGSAIGNYGSLRDAIGQINTATGKWEPKIPDPSEYRTMMEPHARGSILVSAVFEAFISIYKTRVADLLRLVSNGTGVLQQGELQPDLVNRLADEAAKAAGQILNMCIRALDYCPPVDITFGDYLRAIITADSDVVKDDSRNYRLAFIDAFRRRGIYPEGIKTLSEESLRFTDLDMGVITDQQGHVVEDEDTDSQGIFFDKDTRNVLGIINGFLRDYGNAIKYVKSRKDIYEITRKYISGGKDDSTGKQIIGLHTRLNTKLFNSAAFSRITGLTFSNNFTPLGIRPSSRYENTPSIQLKNLRLVSRVGPANTQINQVVFSLIQRSYINKTDNGFEAYRFTSDRDKPPKESFEFAGGCTLIFDLDNLKLRYSISKPLLNVKKLSAQGAALELNFARLQRQYDYQYNTGQQNDNEFAAYFSDGNSRNLEPFAFIHQH